MGTSFEHDETILDDIRVNAAERETQLDYP
jgi:hypothetical protein